MLSCSPRAPEFIYKATQWCQGFSFCQIGMFRIYGMTEKTQAMKKTSYLQRGESKGAL